MARAHKSDSERDESIRYLRGILQPGDTVYTIVHHVARSGMSRDISVYVVGRRAKRGGDSIIDITGDVARATSHSMSRRGARVHGCGMDMCWHLVSLLGKALWPVGTPRPHGRRNGVPDSDGGYALRQRAL